MKMSYLEGQAYENTVTKQLTSYIPKKRIAVLHHEDIDSMAANSLIECKVKAVLNYKISMTGKYDHDGVVRLIEAGIPVYDILEVKNKELNLNESYLRIRHDKLYKFVNDRWLEVATISRYHFAEIDELKQQAKTNFPQQFLQFAENSLYYAQKELKDFSAQREILSWVKNENVLIVVRGANFEKDLQACWKKLKKQNMKVIAVDGAADRLLQLGISIDAVVGDMDSVSVEALKKSRRRYVHTYMNGKSPGEERLKTLKLPYENIQFIGTSEDIAILFSFWSGAKKIFLIGSHSSMNEFLEKGRKGMGSSILVRMQANDKIIDLKGYYEMEQQTQQFFISASMVPIAISFFLMALNFRKLELLMMLLKHWFFQ